MQWRVAPPGELAEQVLRWMMRRGFPLLVWVAPRVPRWFLVAGAWVIINIVMLVYPAPKRAARSNLASLLEKSVDDRDIRRFTRRLIHSFGMAWADMFNFANLERDKVLELVTDRQGVERLDAVYAAGKGAILLTAHLGPWEVGALIVRSLGMPISIVYIPDRFAEAEEFRSTLRRSLGGDVEEIPIDMNDQLSTLPALRALAAGRLVAMQGDRDFNDRGSPVDFCGRRVRFPAGPLLLARMTGAPVLPAFVAYRSDFTIAVEVGEAFFVPRTQDRDGDLRVALQHWADILEDVIRRYPTQWFTFYDLFAHSAVGPEAAAEVPAAAKSA